VNEIRLTFRSEDFGPVSKVLVDMGVSFRVEPLTDAEPEAPRAKPPPPAPRKAPRKAGRKAAAPPRHATRSEDRIVTGADRLREAVIRNQVTPPGEAPSDE
jgi:hypothetical protein